jgi:hypothetical protein
MSWENDVYIMEAPPPKIDPIVKMALTPSAYSRLPEAVEGHIAEYLLPRRIPAGTRGKKYRSPQNILKDRRFKKEFLNKSRAYTERAQKRAYNEWLIGEQRKEIMAAIAAQREQFARQNAERRAQDAAEAFAREQAQMKAIMRLPTRPSAERKRQVAKSRARRGQQYNFRPPTLKRLSSKPKPPSKPTRKLRTKARKQNFNVAPLSSEY